VLQPQGWASLTWSLRCQLPMAPRVPTGWTAAGCAAGPMTSPVVAPASTRSSPAVPRSDVRVTPGAYSLTPRTVALSDRSAPTTQVSLQPKVRNSASVRNLNKLTYIVINCHKKTFVHLLSSGMAHKSLHTVLWRCAVNEAPRLVTCFDIVTEGLRSYCGAHMRGYAAIRATTYWPAQGFAAPLRQYDNVSNCL